MHQSKRTNSSLPDKLALNITNDSLMIIICFVYLAPFKNPKTLYINMNTNTYTVT